MKLIVNEGKHYCAGASISIMSYMLGGAILQAFMAECGVLEDRIGIFVAVMQIVQICMITLLSPIMDRVKRVVLVNAVFPILSFPMIAICLYLCFDRAMGDNVMFLLFFVGGLVWNVAYGIYSVVTYKLPYHIIDMKYYGRIMSRGGAISGIVGVVFSAIMTYMHKSIDYFDAMLLFYGVCLLFSIVYILVSLTYKERPVDRGDVQKANKRIKLLTYKPFTVLIVPNLLRGFCMGVFGMAVTVGYYFEIIDATAASLIVVITSVMNIFSSIVFDRLNRAVGTGRLILLSSIVLALSMPLMLVGKGSSVFLLFYGIGAFAINVVNCTVPVAVVKLIDYEIAGSYNGYRMMLNTCGSAIAGFVLIGMCDLFGGFFALLISGAFQVASGMVYYIYLKKNEQ